MSTKTIFVCGLLVICCVPLLSCGARDEPAGLVVLGGKIVTMDPKQPEVEAVAARGQEIVAVGSEREIRLLIGSQTEVIDLEGAVAVPGLIDGHGHFLGLGRMKMKLDLTTADNWGEVVAMVAQATRESPPGQWIRGRGWHQEKWDRVPEPNVNGMPTHDELSRVSPDHPVFLDHASGHAAIVNARAMNLLGIDATTANPEGGEIVRDSTGRSIGVVLDNAREWANNIAKIQLDGRTGRQMVGLASEECLGKGVTSFQDSGSKFSEVELLSELADRGELDVRLWVMLREKPRVLAEGLPGFRIHRAGNGFLTVGGIKLYLDGALGSHTAWLLEPYADLPQSSGLRVDSDEIFEQTAGLALEHQLQLCTHAIGDRANHEALNLYEEIFRQHPDLRDLRWRIEHAQHLNRDDIPRFGTLGVIAAMQPIHCTSDGPWVPLRLGIERSREGAYVWRDLIDSGAVIAGGTDAPVEDVDPIVNFFAAITRRMPSGSAFFPGQVMTREEALRTVTIDAAYAAFEEDIKGSLEVGKLADITVLSQDILAVPVDEILSTRVLYTIVGGQVKYRSDR